jgi:hypothetical protein
MFIVIPIDVINLCNFFYNFINRVFDFLLKEKASDIGNSLNGLLAAVGAAVVKPFKKKRHKHFCEIIKNY